MDKATKKNLDDLVKVGEGLLKKQVSRVNLDTGLFEPTGEESNEEALKRYKSNKYLTSNNLCSKFCFVIMLV